jgi:hypothetical protein
LHKAADHHSHFKGKGALQHVIEARQKGKLATAEIHGTELPGHYFAAADSAKETALLLLLFQSLFSEIKMPSQQLHWALLLFLFGWLLWKVGRSAILGWARLERLHRLIEEERWEIEHHRSQEKEELTALYAAKGFEGKLLHEVVEHLFADDNRLLQAMLEEELGLDLESHEHPLKQAFGAACGLLLSAGLMSLPLFWFSAFPIEGALFVAIFIIGLAAGITAKKERNRRLPAIIWNIAAALVAVAAPHFLGESLRALWTKMQ